MSVTLRGDDQDAGPAEVAAAAPPRRADAQAVHADEALVLERLRMGAAGAIDVDVLRARRPVPVILRYVHPATWVPASHRMDPDSAPATCPSCLMPLTPSMRYCRRCGTCRSAAEAVTAS